MSPRSWRFGLALAALCATPVGAGAARRDWIGSERCGSCHPAQLAAWRATAHARVRFFSSSPSSSPSPVAGRATAVCLGCHTTGEAPAGPVIEPAVGCEACHGAGADYAAADVMRNRRLALDLGLVDLAASSSASSSGSSPSSSPSSSGSATLAGSPVRAAVCAGCHRAVAMRPGVDLSRPAHPLLRTSSAAPPSRVEAAP